MNITGLQKLATNFLASPTLKQHVVWQNHRCLAVILQDGADMKGGLANT
jgi:hypothetical protein